MQLVLRGNPEAVAASAALPELPCYRLGQPPDDSAFSSDFQLQPPLHLLALPLNHLEAAVAAATIVAASSVAGRYCSGRSEAAVHPAA